MKKAVMQVAKYIRESDIPLVDVAYERCERAAKSGAGWVAVKDLVEQEDRTRLVQAMRLTGLFEFSVMMHGSTLLQSVRLKG